VLWRHGKVVAAVISMEDLQEFEAAEDRADLAAAREALASEERRIPQLAAGPRQHGAAPWRSIRREPSGSRSQTTGSSISSTIRLS
jgi:hypothetical protein